MSRSSAVVDIRHTFGVGFIGLILITTLGGVTVAQTWNYYRQYRGRDPIALKGFVAILFILDTLHTILCCHSIYWYLVLNFGNVDNLAVSVWSTNVQVGINAFVGYLVQLFYARRVYFISESVIVPTIIVILGGACCCCAFVFTIRSFVLLQYSRIGSLMGVASVSLATGSATDILIAAAMCWYLYHKKTGFSRTDTMITTLMTYSINTGMLTSAFATCALLAFAVDPANNYHLSGSFYWLMGKCYVNSFLAILNNRDNITKAQYSISGSSRPLHLESVQSNRRFRKSKSGSAPVIITVHKESTPDFATNKHPSDNEPGLNKPEGITLSSLRHDSPESVSGVEFHDQIAANV